MNKTIRNFIILLIILSILCFINAWIAIKKPIDRIDLNERKHDVLKISNENDIIKKYKKLDGEYKNKYKDLDINRNKIFIDIIEKHEKKLGININSIEYENIYKTDEDLEFRVIKINTYGSYEDIFYLLYDLNDGILNTYAREITLKNLGGNYRGEIEIIAYEN